MTAGRLRRATAEDLDAVVDLFLDSWAGYADTLPRPLVERWGRGEATEYWRARLADPDGDLVLAEGDAGKPLGFVRFGPGPEPGVGELSSLYVRWDASGAGLGGILLRDAEREMRLRGWSSARLWVFAANLRARRFYERQGWRADGPERIEAEFGELELGLWKRLLASTRMQLEMEQQPAVLEGLLARRGPIGDEVRDAVGKPAGVQLLARGSSDNAAIYARYLLEIVMRRPVSLVAPSLWTRYGLSEPLDDHVVVAVSQSGETPEIVSTMRAMVAAGARSVAITNSASSALGGAADLTVSLGAGVEEAVPATKTFTTTMMAVALIAEALGSVSWDRRQWSDLLAVFRFLLADVEPPRAAAKAFVDDRAVVHLGRGPLYSIALEGALKLAETTSISASGYSSADFLHGPIARATPGTAVVAYVGSGPVADDVHLTATKSAAGGASLVVVGDDDRGQGLHVPVPAGLDEWLAPIAYAVRAQQLALFATEALDIDPDRPPSLNKVTATT